MITIGITGGIGSGKSEVALYLREIGYALIDADEIAREAAVPGEPPSLKLREIIGAGIFLKDGSLDRPRLAKLVFNDPSVQKIVNEIFHEDIRERIESKARDLEDKGEKVIFLCVPLLFESEAKLKTDEIWLVSADEYIRIGRVIQRDGMSEEDVRARLNSQMPEEEKRKRAGIIIENNGTLLELRAAVDELLSTLS
jgi:dephospho-CoA kinase